ncbi:sulfatase [Actinomadura vinacea]|uniref:Sulfatase n=1 Tax=Actinomadura vinacea TaxID=115336 RepID=A0ABN3JRK6_9ACTN
MPWKSKTGRGRRRALTIVPATAFLTTVAGIAGCGAPAEWAGADGAGKERPNVVVIMTDDQWLESMRVMSRTRGLIGGQGVTFSRYYASEPLCCPSRASYLTGQFAHNNGVRHNALPQGGYEKLNDKNTLPVWLKNAGYATSHIGKYPNGYGRRDKYYVPPGWTEWRGSLDPTTYQMYGYTLNENGRLTTYGKADVEDPKYYQTDVYRDKATDFIKRRSSGDRPFFLSVAFLAPHGENGGIGPAPRPAPRHKGRFSDEPLPRKPSFDEADVSDKPGYMRNRPRLDAAAKERVQTGYRGRLEALLAVDEAVGGIVETLDRSGELDNTYLLFTSDNGFFFGEHRIPAGKYLPHEASAHLPFMMRGPGLPTGRTSQEGVANIDLAPTIAEATGVRPGLMVDGRSMLPYARRPDLRTTRPLLHEGGDGALPTVVGGNQQGPTAADTAGRAAAQGDLDQDLPGPRKRNQRQVLSIAYEAIRTERYLYMRLKSGERELYDYKTDLYEQRSVHNDPRYAQVRAQLDRHLTRLQGCKGSACRQAIPR